MCPTFLTGSVHRYNTKWISNLLVWRIIVAGLPLLPPLMLITSTAYWLPGPRPSKQWDLWTNSSNRHALKWSNSQLATVFVALPVSQKFNIPLTGLRETYPCSPWETISSWLDVSFLIDRMSPLTIPLIFCQLMQMDDVVLLTRETSAVLGAGIIKKELHAAVRIYRLGLVWKGVWERLCACSPAVMLKVTGELSVKDSFSVRTAKW